MKILVTGVTGFIGQNLAKSLAEAGFDVVGLCLPDENTSKIRDYVSDIFFNQGDPAQLSHFLLKTKPEGVVHLAANTTFKHQYADVSPMINANLILPSLLLDFANRNGMKWFINTGSYWQNSEVETHKPVNFYAATKQAFEDLAKGLGRPNGTLFCTLRLFDNYGCSDSRPKIVNTWRKYLNSDEPLRMSPGYQKLCLFFIDDIISGYLHLMKLLMNSPENIVSEGVYYLKPIEILTLRDYAEIFQKVYGGVLNIQWGALPYKDNEIMSPVFAGTPLPGWEPKVSFENGLKMMRKEDKCCG